MLKSIYVKAGKLSNEREFKVVGSEKVRPAKFGMFTIDNLLTPEDAGILRLDCEPEIVKLDKEYW